MTCPSSIRVGVRQGSFSLEFCHGGGQVLDEGKSLGVQILKHHIRFPAADKADGVGINLAAEERHGPSQV